MEEKKAYFVHNPRDIRELIRPHAIEQERAYQVVATVALGWVDYENFSEDMTVQREYLLNKGTGSAGTPLSCILVKEKGEIGGVLVHPREDWVEWAAYLPEG